MTIINHKLQHNFNNKLIRQWVIHSYLDFFSFDSLLIFNQFDAIDSKGTKEKDVILLFWNLRCQFVLFIYCN